MSRSGQYSRDQSRGDSMDTPEVVTQSEWLEARKALLAKEKEVTRLRDELSAERRRLPMVEIEKDYRFVGRGRRGRARRPVRGPEPAADLPLHVARPRGRGLPVVLVPRRQHRRPRAICTRVTRRSRSSRAARSTTSTATEAHGLGRSRGTRRSAATSTTTSTSRSTATWRRSNTTIATRPAHPDRPGLAGLEGRAARHERVPARRRPRLPHLLRATRARGDILIGTYNWLDLTARGRQEKWEQPPGRNDGSSGMQWLRRHDEYPASNARAAG